MFISIRLLRSDKYLFSDIFVQSQPFFHILANTIAAEIGEDNPHAILATTVVAFSLSSILTGLSFFLLGALRLGSLIGFFPRHILVGCVWRNYSHVPRSFR